MCEFGANKKNYEQHIWKAKKISKTKEEKKTNKQNCYLNRKKKSSLLEET